MPLKPVYYIYGADDYLVEEAVKAIKAEALSGPFASMNCHVYEGKGINAHEVVSAALTMPAFADKRFILIKGAEAIKAAEEKVFMGYVKDPSPSTCLVFSSLAAKPPASDLVAFFRAKGYVKACNRLDEKSLMAWIATEARAKGKEITPKAASRLMSITGEGLRDVKRELDKVITFVGANARIEAADIDEVGLDCREETAFDISKAISERDVKGALRAFRKVEGEEPLKILGAITWQMRTLLKVKALLNKDTPAQKIPSLARVSPAFLDGYMKNSRRFTEEGLRRSIARLLEADTALKTGRLPEPLVIPALIMDLCSL